MKQMTKEELIEYFIKQLGDNEILGKVMSIEQIRNELNLLIEDVTYTSEEYWGASWDPELKRVNFDMEKIPSSLEAAVIVHELIHVLSTSIIQDAPNKLKLKVGLQYSTEIMGETKEEFDDSYMLTGLDYLERESKGEGQEFNYLYNVAINEGMTDVLSERITGEENSGGYIDEKMIYMIISTIVGEDTILEMYFSDDIVENPSKIFEDVINEKYGEKNGIVINEYLRKVLALSDDVNILEQNDGIYGLDEEGKRLYGELRNEMCATLGSMLEMLIDKEPYLLNRNDIISIIEYYSEDDIKKQLLTNLINSDSLDYNKKLEILQYLNKGYTIGRVLLKSILDEEAIFSSEEKINIESSLVEIEPEKLKNEIYEQYVEAGRIIENDAINKREIFNKYIAPYISIYRSNQDIDNNLKKIRYQKVGNYYIVNNLNTRLKKIYDSEHNLSIDPQSSLLKLLDAKSIVTERDRRTLSKILPREKVDELVEQLRNQIPASCKENASEYTEDLEIVGNMLRYRINGKEELVYDEFFEVNSNGELEVIQKR